MSAVCGPPDYYPCPEMSQINARVRLLTVVATALVLGGCAGAASPSASSSGTQESPATSYARRAAAQLQVEALPGAGGGPFEGRELDLPLARPDFVLTDTAGQPFDFRRDATAPVTLLYFGYTGCPDVCPTHMAAISRALAELPAPTAEQVQVLFVSVDAVNDTPEQLREYLASFGAGFVGLTGTADEVNAAMRSVGLPPTAISNPDEFPPKHPSDVLAYDDGQRAHVVYPFGTPPTAYAADLAKLVDHDWKA